LRIATVLSGEIDAKGWLIGANHFGETASSWSRRSRELSDARPRDDFDAEATSMLVDLAAIAVDELKLRNLSMLDGLTGTSSRRAFRGEGERLIALATRHLSPLACAVLDVDHFKSVNDRYAAQRRPCDVRRQTGRPQPGDGHSIVDCTVRGLSRETATIEVNTTAGIPEQFKLVIAVDALSRACRITAKHDNRIEVAFT
jgi:hypothetical protein